MKAPEEMEFFDATEAAFEVEVWTNDSRPLERCLDTLPELQRTCVDLFYYRDKSYREIADALEEEVGKIRSYIQNGRRNLKNCLERMGLSNAAGSSL